MRWGNKQQIPRFARDDKPTRMRKREAVYFAVTVISAVADLLASAVLVATR